MIRSAHNYKAISRVRSQLENTLRRTLVKGFYGSITVSLKIQDGSIQNLTTSVTSTSRPQQLAAEADPKEKDH